MPTEKEREDDSGVDASGVPHTPLPLVAADELRRLVYRDPLVEPQFPSGQDMHDRDPDPEGER